MAELSKNSEKLINMGFGQEAISDIGKVAEMITANAMWEQGIVQKDICHRGQPTLASVVANCDKRAIGSQGGFGYKSLLDIYDISVMDSAILAYWLASTSKEAAPQKIQY